MGNPARALTYESEVQFLGGNRLGDRETLEKAFARHGRALYQAALRILGSPQEAEDAVQDGLLSAYRNLPKFEGRSQFSTWLTRIVLNAALMRRRHERSRPAVSLEEPMPETDLPLAELFADPGPTPEQLYERTEIREAIRENLESLSPILREAFELREMEGLSTTEAARTLGVSENTLKARLWRARQHLAEGLCTRLRGKTKAGQTPAFVSRLCGCEGQ